jgi:hypothetical protein
MFIQKSYYEASLASCCDALEAIALLKEHRLYLEMIPSLRRLDESVVTIPLPIVRLRSSSESAEVTCLPCDVAIIICDPEWKIKLESEILIFIHRPHEDFSDLLGRWRQTQVWLDKDYEWFMPTRYKHILSEGLNTIYPLFVIFPQTPERIKRGLSSADLPFVTVTPETMNEDNILEIGTPQDPPA